MKDFTPFMQHITNFRITISHTVNGERAQNPHHTIEVQGHSKVQGHDEDYWQVSHVSNGDGSFLGGEYSETYWDRIDHCWIPYESLPVSLKDCTPETQTRLENFRKRTMFTSVVEALEVAIAEAATIQFLQDDYDIQNSQP